MTIFLKKKRERQRERERERNTHIWTHASRGEN